MILLDIANNNIDNEIIESNTFILQLNNIKYNNNASEYNNIKIFDMTFNNNNTINVKVKICKFLGEGSYGKVFKIKINNVYYALKINNNENPYKLVDRYNSLINIDKLGKYIINMYVCGSIKSDNYSYFSIMEYGGKTLKNILPITDITILSNILKQLYNIVHLIEKHKILMTDFKLGNITVNSEYRIRLIDLYMYCDSYSPCKQCKIVKTYSVIEIEKERNIYENPDYNYTCIYIPFAVCLIDLLCKSSASSYCSNLANHFNIKLNIKGIIPLLQIACFNFSNSNNNSINNYKNIISYKNKLEHKYPVIKKREFYEYFMSLIEPKDNINFSKKRILHILNDLLSIDPNQRSLMWLKNKLVN